MGRQSLRQAKATEHQVQAAFFELVHLEAKKQPELALCYAIPNGGNRAVHTAQRLRAEGVKPGVPDVHLPVPRGAYAGLWIEFKVRPNQLTDRQIVWKRALEAHGHMVVVCHEPDKAFGVVMAYLRMGGEREQNHEPAAAGA